MKGTHRLGYRIEGDAHAWMDFSGAVLPGGSFISYEVAHRRNWRTTVSGNLRGNIGEHGKYVI